MKGDYHPCLEKDGTIDDYMELVIQFGFLNLFGVCFPLAFLLAFINDVVEIQVDKSKLIKFLRRPMPKGAADIGTWLIILDFISFLAIFSNAAIIIFTSNSTDGLALGFLVFVFLLVVFLILKYFIRYLIPDVPGKADTLMKRHNYIIQKYNKALENMDSKNYKATDTNLEVACSKKKL